MNKADLYLQKYGEFEAYYQFGEDGDTIERGIEKMRQFYKDCPEAPV